MQVKNLTASNKCLSANGEEKKIDRKREKDREKGVSISTTFGSASVCRWFYFSK